MIDALNGLWSPYGQELQRSSRTVTQLRLHTPLVLCAIFHYDIIITSIISIVIVNSISVIIITIISVVVVSTETSPLAAFAALSAFVVLSSFPGLSSFAGFVVLLDDAAVVVVVIIRIRRPALLPFAITRMM